MDGLCTGLEVVAQVVKRRRERRVKMKRAMFYYSIDYLVLSIIRFLGVRGSG
jgi:hypothetical protein